MKRREVLKAGIGAGAAILAAPMVNVGRFRLFAGDQTEYSKRAVELVGRSLIIDMLNPVWLSFSQRNKYLGDPSAFTAEQMRQLKGSATQVFHIALGIGGKDAYLNTLKYLAGWNGFVAHHADAMLRIDDAASFERAKSAGKPGILLGMQNSEHFQTLDDVNFFHSIGQRVSQLTYNSRNYLGDGSTERRDGGLSDFGAAVIERMNKVGMAVDVSHCGDGTTLDACSFSKKPVLITHSNCRALVPGHPRCKTDEMIEKMAATGGVMGITGVRMFVKAGEPTTVEHVLDHYDHVARLAGADHVGIGSDIGLEGYDKMPAEENKQLRSGYKGSYGFRDKIDVEGLDHPKRVYDLTEGLIRRNYSDRDIELILGGNFKRALTEIWSAGAAPSAA